MNVLIIGGTGLIRTPLTKMLLEQGHTVTHFNRGNKQDEFPDVQTIVGDRTDYATFKTLLGNQTFDCIINMICYKPDDAKSAVETFQNNIGQYIFCSKVGVYTKPASRYPITEDAARQPSQEFMYAHDKARCEEVFSSALEQNNFPVTILRPAYTYREGVGILHTFGRSTDHLERIRTGKPIITHGDGNSFWVACHADDVARAFVNAIGKHKRLVSLITSLVKSGRLGANFTKPLQKRLVVNCPKSFTSRQACFTNSRPSKVFGPKLIFNLTTFSTTQKPSGIWLLDIP